VGLQDLKFLGGPDHLFQVMGSDGKRGYVMSKSPERDDTQGDRPGGNRRNSQAC